MALQDSVTQFAAQFDGTSQQDSQEYLTVLLETLHAKLTDLPNYRAEVKEVGIP